MNLLQITVSKVWRGHEQKIIYLYEAFENNPEIDNQFIFCAKNTPVFDIATEKKMQVTGLIFLLSMILKLQDKFQNLLKNKTLTSYSYTVARHIRWQSYLT